MMIQAEPKIVSIDYNGLTVDNVTIEFFATRQRFEASRNDIFPQAIYMPENATITLEDGEMIGFANYERMFAGEDFVGYEYKSTDNAYTLIVWPPSESEYDYGDDPDNLDNLGNDPAAQPTKPKGHASNMLHNKWQKPD